MAFTASQLAALEAAIASGILSVRFDGPPARTITYQSMADLIRARDIAKATVDNAADGSRTTYGSFSKD